MIRVSVTESISNRQPEKSRYFCLLPVLAIAVVFFAVSLLSRPVPGVNEPHYLCKARSFSDPAWCQRDFFLTSADAHYCFFWLVGPFTQVSSFAAVALTGRWIAACILAIGWTVLSRSIGLSARTSVESAGIFAFLTQLGSFSGEWLLDGFESKVLAWGFGLTAIGLWIRGTLNVCPGWMTTAGIACGVGVMLHPVVGGWIAVCICMVWLFDWMLLRRSFRPTGALKPVIGILAFSLATIIVALPGLIPAVKMLLDRSLSNKERELATFIQVFWRLKHHLDPTELTKFQWGYAGGLLALLIVTFMKTHKRGAPDNPVSDGLHGATEASQTSCGRFLLFRFFVAAMMIAVAGVAIGWHFVNARDMAGWQWRAGLLKFYPFRTFDAMLPIISSMFVATLLQQNLACRSRRIRAGLSLLCLGLPIAAATIQRDSVPPGYSAEQFTDWQAACAWIRTETDTTALFLTPRESFGFKWYAERAEYVCYKDCPQDAGGILEWNRRLWWLHSWTLSSSSDGVYDRSDLEQLRAQIGCDYIITRILGPFETAPDWTGKYWQIIKVP
ncbi:MAG: hypothetical protein KDB01_16250 [Planctomycetaceae bacterium]|nr:hypothetical protein [Planctomycetaceae bacterium]